MKAFGLSPELFEALQNAEVLKPEADGSFDLASVAANLFNYGMANARTANERLLAAASALNETLPALQRLSDLPQHADLDAAAREVVTQELSQFFQVFAKALGHATEVLQASD